MPAASFTTRHPDVDILPSLHPSSPTTPKSKGDAALQELLAQNAAFVRGEERHFPHAIASRSHLAADGQAPVAAVLACADSRVAPELIFRAGLGEIFVVRTAGNTATGDEALGSLEYAVDHLGVDLVIVLGHTHCGAVGAAVGGGDQLPGALGRHVHGICEGLAAHGGLGHGVGPAVECNVRNNVSALREDGCVAVAERERGLKVVGAVYDISSGTVKVLA